jgi:2-dehydropantoate 2-reductase
MDLVLVGVKLWDTESAARAVAPLVSDGAAVILALHADGRGAGRG